MVCNYFFSSEDEKDFHPNLLMSIKNQYNGEVESTLKNTTNFCAAVDTSGSSLLHYAAEYGNLFIAHLLLESGAKVDLQNEKGQTPLALATIGLYHDEMVEFLLNHGADMHIADKDGISALQLAMQQDILCWFGPRMFLAKVAKAGSSSEIADVLLKVNCPLYIAACLGDLNIVARMLSEGCPIDARGSVSKYTALHIAAERGYVKMVKFLVDRGADVDALNGFKQTPLASITKFEDTKILQILMNEGTDLTVRDQNGELQIHTIFTKGTCEAVRIILRSGFDLRVKDANEQTPIHYLASNTNVGILEVVKEWTGEANNEKNIFSRMRSLFKYTGSQRADRKIFDWNARDKDGRTALHNAVYSGNVNFVRYLIGNGANVNVKTVEGVSPFLETLKTMESTVEQRAECVKIIMKHGVDLEGVVKCYINFYKTKADIDYDWILIQTILARLILREAKGERFAEKLFDAIERHPKPKNYVASCREQLNRMKKEKIYLSRASDKFMSLFEFFNDDADNKLPFYSYVYSQVDKLIKKHKYDSYYSCILREKILNPSKVPLADPIDILDFSIRSIFIFVNIYLSIYTAVGTLVYGLDSRKTFEEMITNVTPTGVFIFLAVYGWLINLLLVLSFFGMCPNFPYVIAKAF